MLLTERSKSKMRFNKNSGGDGSVPGTPVIHECH
jgi:hypothetical protein